MNLFNLGFRNLRQSILYLFFDSFVNFLMLARMGTSSIPSPPADFKHDRLSRSGIDKVGRNQSLPNKTNQLHDHIPSFSEGTCRTIHFRAA
jgi:hypothetical protein